eukprot:GHVS01070387.1.p1 GENE.GHVS01070387.1~~GHVS01070387.1.p1  ORF type:complete len:456 (-),score=106.57 GHVS01070387.1:123-1490(-)
MFFACLTNIILLLLLSFLQQLSHSFAGFQTQQQFTQQQQPLLLLSWQQQQQPLFSSEQQQQRHLQSSQLTTIQGEDIREDNNNNAVFPPPPLILPPPILPSASHDSVVVVVNSNVFVPDGGSAALAEAVASSSCDSHYPMVVGDIGNADTTGSIGVNFTSGAIDEGGRRVVRAVEGWRSSPDIMDNLQSLCVDMYKLLYTTEQQQQQNEQQDNDDVDGLLSSNGISYIKSLLVYLVPTFLSIAILLFILPLSACTCCSTKCRSCVSCSCCLLWCCGARRQSPRPFPVCNRIVGSVGVILLTIGITAVALLAVFWTDKLHSGLSKTQCVLSSLVSDAINGSEGDKNNEGFVGLLPALQIMSDVSEQLDPAAVEGVMARLEDIVETALNVTNYKDELIDSLDDLTMVLNDDVNNPDRTTTDEGTHHMFVFNSFVSDLLMLPKFNAEISEVRKNTLWM